jgi:hypothetical protein
MTSATDAQSPAPADTQDDRDTDDRHTDDRDMNDESGDAARLYAQQVAAFRVHAVVFAASMILIFGVNLATNLAAGIAGQWQAWWSAIALLGWGLGVTIHGLVVRMSRPSDHADS